MAQTDLFTPISFGRIEAANRVIMAPLTRNRAQDPDGVPNDLMVDYYRQRAGAGVIITEATQISPEGKGYAWTPGIHSDAQVAGWKKITDAVHEAGGKIVLQLWHVGRISHVSLQPDGQKPVAPSAIAAEVQTFDGTQMVDVSEPRALEREEIPRVIADYRKAAENAKAAGFDGVEVHAANGYLLDQFLRDGSNTRDDDYGGSIENRTRLLFDVLDAVTDVWGPHLVGLRLSPFSNANGISDSDPMPLFRHVVEGLAPYDLAFLHMVEGQTGGSRDLEGANSIADLRKLFRGAYIANNGYDREKGIEAVASGAADAVAYGRPFIANPDLPERLKQDAPLNDPDPATFYGGGAEGYTDYPTLNAEKAA
ncbi:alkene reductase [Pacificitalea manganoxidans]|uniref:Alkene reductase n=1 Tax=Pacificitalea manganoxidans TaxID=1411902 RepID=A0A291M0Q3_9RHOB|nr:alkene reductase [Pacificitalea manganoxidans]ATI42546.1 alkene reductase [Pacificitalea manganoxidans]MDR6307590.1 N-ethylmaleimide reductase [Pacificitalea manganoxidans]